MWSNISSRFSFLSIFLVAVLLPLFFLPFIKISVLDAKGLCVVLGLAFSVISWAISSFSQGKIVLPKSSILFAGLGIVLVFLVSSLFSTSIQASMFGTFLDIGTFWFIVISFLLMFMSAISFKENKDAQMLLFSLLFSSVIVLVFQILRFFLPQALSLGILNSSIDNLVGSWNTLGIFAGFTALTSLAVIEFFSVPKLIKLLLSFFILLSLFIVACVNFALIWQLLFVFTLFIFIFKVFFSASFKQDNKRVNFPVFSFTIVIISMLFLMAGPFVISSLPRRLGLSNEEVFFSASANINLAKQALKHDPVLGVGPNKFAEVWALYKPESINQSNFWDTYVSNGFSLLFTLMTTTGILGILSFLVFFVLLVYTGIKSIFASIKHNMHREMTVFFLLALYLFTASFFYNTGSVIFFTAFILTGVFVGLVTNNNKKEISISFLEDHRKSFFLIFFLVCVMVISIGFTFRFIERFISIPYLHDAVYHLKTGSMSDAELDIQKAVSLYPNNDLYLRSYSQLYISKVNVVISKLSSTLSESDNIDINNSIVYAHTAAVQAIAYDPNNYLNHLALANVDSLTGALAKLTKKESAPAIYAEAAKSYARALELNPRNPAIKLSLARAYFSSGKIKEAKDYAEQALSSRGDYVDALIFLSRVATKEGNIDSAMSYKQKALSFANGNDNLRKYIESALTGN